MRIDLTAAGPAGSRDVAITAAPSTPLDAFAGALRAAVDAPAGAALWHAGRALPPEATLAAARLRTGAILAVGAASREPARPGVLSLHVVGGPGAGRIVPIERGTLTIGRAPDCDLVLADDGASRKHAQLVVDTQSLHLRDLGSTNRTLIDDVPVGPHGTPLRQGQMVRIGDTLLSVAGPDDAPAAVTVADTGLLVNRAPRPVAAVDARTISVPEQSESSRPRGVQWISALLPALAGGALAWFSRSPQFLLFALLSPLMMISGALGDRVHWRRSRRRSARTLQRRRAAADAEIAAGLAAEAVARRRAAPDPATVRRIALTPTTRLWERRRGDPDFLSVRLGSGSARSVLQARTGSTSGPAGVVPHVPVGADLRSGPLGIAGPADVLPAVAAWAVAQLGVLHSPADLQLVLLLTPVAAAHWSWARWLPHLQGRVGTEPDEWAVVVGELAELVEARRRSRAQHGSGWAGPWVVLLLDRASGVMDLPTLASLLSDGPTVGVAAICVDTEEQALPTSCTSIARIAGAAGTRVDVRRADGSRDEAVLDRVDPEWVDAVARGLAPLVDARAEAESAMPDSCRLVDVLGLGDLSPAGLAARWGRSSGCADTVLGLGADSPVRVDLGVDGPHALIAGTTGAGKSELLQTLVAGLAADHPPDEVTFLLIDYKGGAAFAECARLPHTAGVVTDLDPHLTRRALASLDAELRRRERLFAAAGASGIADLGGYRRSSGTEPLARLVIVVDEFAALADELPDFVRGLVAVAQRGRSLGVHLVLATQRPGTAVSAEIRANTSLRIALRVTDPAESQDVIGTADAAAIPRSVPGRAYLRAGARSDGFQTARVSGRAAAELVGVEVLGAWRRRLPTAAPADGSDLADLVDALRAAAEHSGRAPARSPWLDPLPPALAAARLTTPTPDSVAVAAVDLPAEQRRGTLRIDLVPGSATLVVGAARSGRTGFLATVSLGAAAARPPDELQLYVIDAAGSLAEILGGLPHAGTCLAPADLGNVPALLNRLERAVAERRMSRRSGGSDPALLLVVDCWDALLARLDDAAAARCADQLAALIRSGTGVGLSIVVTGDRSLLAPRFAGLFGERVLLRLSDRGDYAMAGVALRAVPADLPPGRGVRVCDGAEIQTAYPGTDPEPAAARRFAAELAARWQPAGKAAAVIRIRSLPDQVGLAELPRMPDRIVLGLGADSARPVSIDVFAGAGRLLVAGPPRSGRSTALASILAQADRAGTPAIVAASARSPLAAQARARAIRVIDPDDDADSVGDPPAHRVLLLVDDSERFVETAAGDRLTGWVRSARTPVAAIVAGRAEDLASCYRGVAAEVRRSRCGLLLRPGPLDGELLGVRLPRQPATGPPGRGVLVGEAAWGPVFADGEPVPIQVARP